MRKLKRRRRPSILLIGAHPDDITYSAGGLAAMARQLDFDVIEVIASTGQAGSQDEELWPSHLIGNIRTHEQLEANEILGITQTIFFGFEDGQLHATQARLTAELRRLIKRYRPVLVVTYGPDGLTGHPDHRVVSACATQAFRQASLVDSELWYIAATEEWRKHIRPHLESANAMYGPEYPDVFETDDLILDLRLASEVLERKLEAIDAHVSQSQPLDAALAPVGGIEVLTLPWFSHEAYRLGIPDTHPTERTQSWLLPRVLSRSTSIRTPDLSTSSGSSES
jgi:LmbE family N-acetylglucosaminyl deacetylase